MTAPTQVSGSATYVPPTGIVQGGDPNSPDYHSPAYAEMEKRWRFVRMVRNINESIRDHSSEVLPRYEAEGLKAWAVRVGMTFGFDALDETIHAVVGLATRDDPILGPDVPERLVVEWEDFDGQGTHGAVFAQHGLEAAIQDGHAGILVDAPPPVLGSGPDGVPTADDEARSGMRAYCVLVPIDKISAWRVGRVQGRRVLTMVKIEESKEVASGAFGSKTVRRFRTLRQEVNETGQPYVTYEVQEETQGNPVGAGAAYHLVDSGTLRGPTWIPFHPFYGGEKLGILRSLPPLRGLAYSNLDHTQIKSDRRYSMHKCAVPFPLWIGAQPPSMDGDVGDVVMSSDYGMYLPIGGDGKYMEPTGSALAALESELTNIERRMGSQGFSMLRREAQTQTTLGEKQMQATREESKLAKAVRSLNDALEAALGSMAAFYGLPDAGSITMNREFTDDVLTPDELKILVELEDAGKLTLTTLLKQLQKSTPLLEGVDVETEVAEVERMRAEEPALALPGMVPIPPTPGQPTMPAIAPVPEAKAA